MLTLADPGSQPIRQIARLRATTAGKQFLEVAQAAQRRIVGIGGIHRCGDGLFLFGTFGLQQHAKPIAQESLVACRVRQSERIEAGRFAGTDAVVPAPNTTHEQFGAAILVEQDRARAEFLRLRSEEIHDHGLARPRRTDDRKIPQIAVMEVEKERRRAGRFQQRYGFAPMVALRLAESKAMHAAKARHIGAGYKRAAHEIALVTWKLPPEGGFEIGVLAYGDRAGIGKSCGAGRHGIVQSTKIAFLDHDSKVMIAKPDRAIAKRIARSQHIGSFRSRFFIRTLQPANSQIHALAGSLPFGRGIAFTHHHFERQAQQAVE